LFDLPFKNSKYNLSNLKNNCLVVIHAHIFYKDILNEIINRTNNMPVKFDLYISTNTQEKLEFIKNYTNIYSKANNVFIKIFENKGRDILPFLIQIGEVFDKYKYLCHIHSKKSLHSPELGKKWRTYLFNNLLGTTEIISEILSDFENNENLGFIFPENYYKILRFTMLLRPEIKERMNYLLAKIFPGYKISDKYFDFPAGDMFWARTKAIYQIFKIDLSHDIPGEKEPKTILFAIERIWLFLIKKNGYYYKKCFNYYK
jgi:lipopolysaccharide biosynthesis protein